ncbi:MAG TPA: phage baseplate assembly protein V [Ornithinibacter sp.]|nr:phage baseplate assembly protein V [Ornithinibacter sp.]
MAEITYLVEGDANGTGFFAAAEGYFSTRPGSTVHPAPPGGPATTLDDVLADLRARAATGEVFDVVNLVTRPCGVSALRLPVSDARRTDDGGLTTVDTLRAALAHPGSDGYPASLGPTEVTEATTVCLYGGDVGRDPFFVSALAQLFGSDLTICAPLRAGVFRQAGATAEHRLARTWSAPFPRDITTSTTWDAARAEFLAVAVPRFTDHGDAGVEADIRAAAQSATATSAPSFFLSARVETTDPVARPFDGSRAVLPTGSVDDSTVPLSVGPADFTPDPTTPGRWVAWVAVLAQVIEEPVSTGNGAQYRRTAVSRQRAPSASTLAPPAIPPHLTEDPMAQLFGKYRAVVRSDDDPEQRSRLQVDVPALGVNDQWADACLPPVPRGLVQLPGVGSTVWVEFEGGQVDHPVWTGVTWDAELTSGDVTLETTGDLVLRGANVTVESTVLDLDLTSAVRVRATAPTVDVNAPVATFEGMVTVTNLVAKAGVVSPSYTPGVGNVW